jgi:hypothetical protein
VDIGQLDKVMELLRRSSWIDPQDLQTMYGVAFAA